MRPNDAFTEFERTYSYPVDRETVIETMGETTIESPSGDGETIAETLERAGRDRFTSAAQLRDTFFGCLPEEYIGRKYYDDRGDNPHLTRTRTDTENTDGTGTTTDTTTDRTTHTASD